jgi:cell division protein FtsZ
MVAEAAKKAGALLIAIVTSPFGFEGRRRAAQAAAALQEIGAHADAVVHFENDRMAELAAPRSGVAETFAACDELLGGCVEAISHLVSAPGPLGVGLPDLLSVLDGGDGLCLFGTGTAAGDNRAHEALEDAMSSPLLDRGRLLAGAASILVHISGPPSLSFAEVGAVMQEVARGAAEDSLLQLGISTVPAKDAPLIVSIIAKCGAAKPTPAIRQPAPKPQLPKPEPIPEEQEEALLTPETPDKTPVAAAHKPSPAPERPVSPVSRPRPPQGEAKAAASPKIKQEPLQFEPVARGRFEKIEPTIVEGEDLDVPTFLRLTGKKR